LHSTRRVGRVNDCHVALQSRRLARCAGCALADIFDFRHSARLGQVSDIDCFVMCGSRLLELRWRMEAMQAANVFSFLAIPGMLAAGAD